MTEETENMEPETVDSGVSMEGQPDATGSTSEGSDIDENTMNDLKAGKIVPHHRFEEVNKRMKEMQAELETLRSGVAPESSSTSKSESRVQKAAPKPDVVDFTQDDVAKEIYGYTFNELDTTEKHIVKNEFRDRVAEQEAVMDVIKGEIETAVSSEEFSGLEAEFEDVLRHMSETGIHDPNKAIRDLYFEKIVELKSKARVEEALKRKTSARKAKVETGGSPQLNAPVSIKEAARQILRQKYAAEAAH